jgi:D-alanine--poly(phosphoribitol) ligase subunit 2
MKKKIIEIIFSIINDMNKESEDKIEIKSETDTQLYGDGGQLDSIGLINLIVTLEQEIEDEFDTSVTLADERALTQKQSPFQTVDSLANYIEVLLNEK